VNWRMIEQGNLEHAYILADKVGHYFNPTCDQVISRSRGGKLLGGVIFASYTEMSIEIHVASFEPGWLNTNLLWVSFHYPFDQLGVKKVLSRIRSSNRKALDFNRKLGFVDEARIADVYPDADLIIRSMTRDQCRWLKLKPRLEEVVYGR
jgi:hypothetical protein